MLEQEGRQRRGMRGERRAVHSRLEKQSVPSSRWGRRGLVIILTDGDDGDALGTLSSVVNITGQPWYWICL